MSQIAAAGSGVALYERMGERTTQPFAVQILDSLGPIDGATVIDIAAGSGGLAVAAAERGAYVTATDINPAMVARAEERLRPFERCSARIEDFRALTSADAIFDVAISIFGVLAYASWRQGLAEMARVTRRGGQIVLAMWTHREDCSPAHVMRGAFNALFPDREPWPPDMFPVFSEGMLEDSVRNAGLVEVETHIATANWRPISSANVVGECDPMFKNFPGYAALDMSDAEALRASLGNAFQKYAGTDGTIRVPTKAFVVRGWKP